MVQFDDRFSQSKVTELHHLEEENLIRTMAPRQGYKYMNLTSAVIDIDAIHLIDEALARRAEAVPFRMVGSTVWLAFRNPKNPDLETVIESIKARGFSIELYMASLGSISHAWERYKDEKHTSAKEYGVLDINQNSIADIAKTVNLPLDVSELILQTRAENSANRTSRTIEIIFGGAVALGASDVHIEPESVSARVRYRLDGVLWDIVDLEKATYSNVISRLKLLSGTKLNIHDEAQDGRFTFKIGDRNLEIRSSIIPGSYGESIVMRLLDPDASGFTLDSLGLNKILLEVMHEELKRKTGAIITTGPTGSGKSTALYAFLQAVHGPEIKIITLENPVEYKVPGIVQTQISDNYSFASGLRSILRQDPDVIMVGEIRDRDVAETASHAALTGHLVFSTLHTNSAVGAFPRLMDLGIDANTIGSAFNIILGQRLARRLCEHCKKERAMTTEEQTLVSRVLERPVAIQSVFESEGCDACKGIGYKGRVGIYEAVRIDQAVVDTITRDTRESVIREAAKPQGIPTMQQDGIMKVLAGITSLEEIGRVIDLYQK